MMTSSARKRARATLAVLAASVLAASVLAALAGGTAVPASAETYPDRMIKIVVPFTPGGRSIWWPGWWRSAWLRLGAKRGHREPCGCGRGIGVKTVVNAEPDGYTLLFGNVSTLAVIPR